MQLLMQCLTKKDEKMKNVEATALEVLKHIKIYLYRPVYTVWAHGLTIADQS